MPGTKQRQCTAIGIVSMVKKKKHWRKMRMQWTGEADGSRGNEYQGNYATVIIEYKITSRCACDASRFTGTDDGTGGEGWRRKGPKIYEIVRDAGNKCFPFSDIRIACNGNSASAMPQQIPATQHGLKAVESIFIVNRTNQVFFFCFCFLLAFSCRNATVQYI